MKKSPILATIIAMIVMITGVVSPTTASAQSITISQGDKIRFANGNNSTTICTAGYIDENNPVDPSSTFMYSAGHCGDVGQVVLNDWHQPIGVVVENRYANKRNDVNLIELLPSVATGGNVYSGDQRISTTDVRIGDEICSRGANTNQVYCGHVTGVDGTLTVADGNAVGLPGDSGGPAWIPGKGFVGVYAILWRNNNKNVKLGGAYANVDEIDDKTSRPSRYVGNSNTRPVNRTYVSPLIGAERLDVETIVDDYRRDSLPKFDFDFDFDNPENDLLSMLSSGGTMTMMSS